MRSGEDTGAVARQIVAANMYMTLATADRDGRPWASPVWYVPIGAAEALYLEAVAEQLSDAAIDSAIAAFSERSRSCGARAWEAADVLPGAPFRLYRATASAQFVLGPGDERLPVLGT